MAANKSIIPKNRRIILTGNDIDESTGTTREVTTTSTTAIDGPQSFAPELPGDPNRRGILIENTTTIEQVIGEKTGDVIFEVQPTVSESGSVSYFEIGDIRQAANMLIYMGTPSREFSINGRFVSRSNAEATKNWKYVQRLRGWRMPEQSGGQLNATQTPSRLTLTGLGDWFNKIKVRIVSLNIEEPEDVDYIRTNDNKYDVPIIWPVSVTLKEARSIEEMREFDITKFRAGTLGGW